MRMNLQRAASCYCRCSGTSFCSVCVLWANVYGSSLQNTPQKPSHQVERYPSAGPCSWCTCSVLGDSSPFLTLNMIQSIFFLNIKQEIALYLCCLLCSCLHCFWGRLLCLPSSVHSSGSVRGGEGGVLRAECRAGA